MKKRLIMAAALACAMAASPAMGQTLPSVDVFSPGLIQLSEKLGRGERVEMTAQLDAADLFYARDLSLLSQMLDGTTLSYESQGSAAAGSDSLTLTREGETLLTLGMTRDENGAQATVNGDAYSVDVSASQDALAALDALAGTAILERVPLTAVCEAIEGLSPGDALIAGYAVATPFTVERTMSDDGMRLTKINISGSVAREGEAPWTVEGYLRQPGGRSPKDTFAITLAQDEDNTLELAYSALYKSEITRKQRAGTMSVSTTLTAGGKIGGSKVSNRLTVSLKNAWTADGEALQEKITVNATFGRTDNTPGLRMQRLNDMSLKLRDVIRLETLEAGSETIALGEELTFSAVFDGNTFVDVSADMQSVVGGTGEAEKAALSAAPQAQLPQALEQAAVRMAQQIYAQLGEEARKSIEKGL